MAQLRTHHPYSPMCGSCMTLMNYSTGHSAVVTCSCPEAQALCRFAFGSHARARLSVPCVAESGQAVQGAVLHLVSGCYLGLDQQHRVARQRP